MFSSITKHANKRIQERSSFTKESFLHLVDSGCYVNLGSKPGMLKEHLLIYSIDDDSWLVVVRDVINGDIITVLYEEYHVQLFDKISAEAKKMAYSKAVYFAVEKIKSIYENANVVHEQVENSDYKKVKVQLCYLNPDQIRKYKNIKVIEEVDCCSEEKILKACNMAEVKKECLLLLKAGIIGEEVIEEILFLKIMYGKKYIILDDF